MDLSLFGLTKALRFEVDSALWTIELEDRRENEVKWEMSDGDECLRKSACLIGPILLNYVCGLCALLACANTRIKGF